MWRIENSDEVGQVRGTHRQERRRWILCSLFCPQLLIHLSIIRTSCHRRRPHLGLGFPPPLCFLSLYQPFTPLFPFSLCALFFLHLSRLFITFRSNVHFSTFAISIDRLFRSCILIKPRFTCDSSTLLTLPLDPRRFLTTFFGFLRGFEVEFFFGDEAAFTFGNSRSSRLWCCFG